MSTQYTPTPSDIAPLLSTSPFGVQDANALGSQYASDFTKSSTNLLREDLLSKIINTTPEQYNVLRLIMERPIIYKNNFEFKFKEKGFGRNAVTSAAPVASPGLNTNQSLTVAAGNGDYISYNDIIVYPDNTKGVVVSKSGVTVVVKPLTGGTLPAVANGDKFAVLAPISADGQNFFAHYQRMTTVEKYNYIQIGSRVRRWNRGELQQYVNSGTTDYLDLDKADVLEQVRMDMFNIIMNGQRGRALITSDGTTTSANQYETKTAGGIVPLMIDGGAQRVYPTPSTLVPLFEQTAFATNRKREGAVRFIIGTDKMLYQLSKAYKQDGIRYSPNDKFADLNLMEYKVGNMRFVPVTCELFAEESMFPGWDSKLLVLDMETINPVCLRGYSPIEMGETDNKQQGSYRDYKDFWIDYCVSIQMSNLTSSFIMEGTGF
jgi:hypothetical protein